MATDDQGRPDGEIPHKVFPIERRIASLKIT
jgi:hypothetical protein